MKIKLLITSILLTIILTGCNANYSLTIKDGKIKEELSVVEKNSEYLNIKDDLDKSFYDYARLYGEEQDTSVDYNALYSLEECTEDCIYYDKKFINDGDKVGFELSHEFDFDDFALSSIASELIPAFSCQYDGKYLRITGISPTNYLKDYNHLENINFSINTNYKVTGTNLKMDKNGNYIWSSDDKNRKELYIILDTKTIVEQKEEKDDTVTLLLFLAGGLIIALFCCIIFSNKK